MVGSSNHHARSDQGVHGRLGGLRGNCFRAKSQGMKGARDGRKGGAASKGKSKAKTNFAQNLSLVSQFRAYDDLPELVSSSLSVRKKDTLPEHAVVALREFIFGEFHQLEKARMREVVNWWLHCQEVRINLGHANVKKYDLSRKLLEQYCAKAPTGTGVMRSDGRYIFDSKKIRDLASRLVEQQRDEVILGVWRVHIARGEGWRIRVPSGNVTNLAVPAEIELLILEALTVKCVSDKKSGFSFEDYHIIEMEILEGMGYFIKYEVGWSAPIRWQARQLRVLQGQLKPRKGIDKIVTCGPMRRLRFMRRWKVKTSRTRNVTWTPPEEVFEVMKIPLAQAWAHCLAQDINADRVGNTDHSMIFVRLSDSNKMFISGFGNGGLKKLQGDGATFTTVSLDINGVCIGSFDIGSHVEG